MRRPHPLGLVQMVSRTGELRDADLLELRGVAQFAVAKLELGTTSAFAPRVGMITASEGSHRQEGA
jgi:hypothetical protein